MVTYNSPTITKLIRVDEVAELTGFSIPSIYRFVKLGQIPHIKKGRTLIFYRHEVLAWIEAGRVNQ